MKKWMLMFWGTLVFLPAIAADQVDELFRQANEAFQAKDYPGSILLYDSILSQGYESAQLYYNLGNACYKNNQVAPAILNFERALKLDPGLEDARFNLKMANLRVIDNVEAVPEVFFSRWGKALVISRSSGAWGGLSILALWLALAGGAAFLFARPIGLRRLGFYGGVLALLMGLIFLFLGNAKLAKEHNSQEGIIFSQNAYVKSAPDPNSTDLFILHEGVKVSILENFSEWNRIRLADGKEGWVEASSLEDI